MTVHVNYTWPPEIHMASSVQVIWRRYMMLMLLPATAFAFLQPRPFSSLFTDHTSNLTVPGTTGLRAVTQFSSLIEQTAFSFPNTETFNIQVLLTDRTKVNADRAVWLSTECCSLSCRHCILTHLYLLKHLMSDCVGPQTSLEVHATFLQLTTSFFFPQ